MPEAHHHDRFAGMRGAPAFPGPPPTGPTADVYRITGYADGLVGAKRPECDLLRPHFDSGIKFPDPNHPKPDDVRWGGGVRGGITWDGTFYRDLSRYAASGPLFWSVYLKAGSAPGIQQGFWFNFGGAWCHLHDDDPAQMLAGASPRLGWDDGSGLWRLVIEATIYVTHAKALVWDGRKAGGTDPTGDYTRVAGCDPLPALTIAAV
jgi:hypothetical protein